MNMFKEDGGGVLQDSELRSILMSDIEKSQESQHIAHITKYEKDGEEG